jgi:hypothetical protein
MIASMTRLRIPAALLCVVALAGCEKNAAQDITTPATGAFIRFQNYAVNAPGVNFYANDQKLTAISASTCTPPSLPACATTGVEATTGVVYGNSANGANYSMLAPGQYTFTSRIAAATDNGVPISTASMTLADGKFYSYFVSGIYNATTKSADAFVVEDALPTSFDYSKAYIRLVNASVNAPTISATSTLQGTTTTVPLAAGVAYKSASPIVTLVPGLTDITISIGTSSTTFKGVNLLGGHVLTVTLRGDVTSTVAATALTLTSSYNR